MKDFITILNNTSALRVVFYSIVFLIALDIVFSATAHIIKHISKKN